MKEGGEWDGNGEGGEKNTLSEYNALNSHLSFGLGFKLNQRKAWWVAGHPHALQRAERPESSFHILRHCVSAKLRDVQSRHKTRGKKDFKATGRAAAVGLLSQARPACIKA